MISSPQILPESALLSRDTLTGSTPVSLAKATLKALIVFSSVLLSSGMKRSSTEKKMHTCSWGTRLGRDVGWPVGLLLGWEEGSELG